MNEYTVEILVFVKAADETAAWRIADRIRERAMQASLYIPVADGQIENVVATDVREPA